MSNTKNKECMAYKNKLAYIKSRNKELKRSYVTFNPKTEGDLLEYLKDKSVATEIKRLIRNEIERLGN